MRRSRISWVMLVLFLSSCAPTLTPDEQAKAEALVSQPITCLNDFDCDVKWGRAIEWVRENGDFPITHVSKSFIKTAEPRDTEMRVGFAVFKVPLGGGAAQIKFEVRCMWPYCDSAHSWLMRVGFVRFVQGT